jgi:hypothetical protein
MPLARGASALPLDRDRLMRVSPTRSVMKQPSRPLLLSIVSGCIWAVIGYGVAYSLSPIQSTLSGVARMFLGGILAAPLIGVLIGVVSRRFASLGLSWRIAVALGDLYVATFLFVLAGGAARLLFEFSGLPQQLAPRALVLDPVMGAFFGLTYTGYFLVLWPLSYVNHVFVARAWSEGGDR